MSGRGRGRALTVPAWMTESSGGGGQPNGGANPSRDHPPGRGGHNFAPPGAQYRGEGEGFPGGRGRGREGGRGGFIHNGPPPPGRFRSNGPPPMMGPGPNGGFQGGMYQQFDNMHQMGPRFGGRGPQMGPGGPMSGTAGPLHNHHQHRQQGFSSNNAFSGPSSSSSSTQAPSTSAVGSSSNGADVSSSSATSSSSSSSSWETHMSPEGRPYYYNRATGKSSWEKPAELQAAESAAAGGQEGSASTSSASSNTGSDWTEHTADDGRAYYYNKVTNTSAWEPPPEFIAAKKAMAAAAAAAASTAKASEPNRESRPASRGPEERSSRNGGMSAQELASSSGTYKMHGDVRSGPRSTVPKVHDAGVKKRKGLSNAAEKAAARKRAALPKYKDHSEAAAAFRALLSERGVMPGWTWEELVKTVRDADRWEALSTDGARKHEYQAYVAERRRRDAAARRRVLRSTRQAFHDLIMREKDSLRAGMSWQEVSDVLMDSPEWRDLQPDSERREVWEEAREGLRAEELEGEVNVRSAAAERLLSMFARDDGLGVESTWEELTDTYDDSRTFKALNPRDRFAVWQYTYRKLVHQAEDDLSSRMRHSRREERKNREAFKQLLDEAQQRGEITVSTRWNDFWRSISGNEIARAAAFTGGSTVEDMFLDLIDDLELEYARDAEVLWNELDETPLGVGEGEKPTAASLKAYIAGRVEAANFMPTAGPSGRVVDVVDGVEEGEASEERVASLNRISDNAGALAAFADDYARELAAEEARKKRRGERSRAAFKNLLREVLSGVTLDEPPTLGELTAAHSEKKEWDRVPGGDEVRAELLGEVMTELQRQGLSSTKASGEGDDAEAAPMDTSDPSGDASSKSDKSGTNRADGDSGNVANRETVGSEPMEEGELEDGELEEGELEEGELEAPPERRFGLAALDGVDEPPRYAGDGIRGDRDQDDLSRSHGTNGNSRSDEEDESEEEDDTPAGRRRRRLRRKRREEAGWM